MNIKKLISTLKDDGVYLHAIGNRLKLSAPAGYVTPVLLSKIRKHKKEIITLIAPAAVWRIKVDGKSIICIDPAKETEENFKLLMCARFGAERVQHIERYEFQKNCASAKQH